MSLKDKQVSVLRSHMQKIMRSFPASSVQTPCGVKISTSLAHVLLTLFKAQDSLVNQQILAKELSLNKSSIARICTELEESGFIKIGTNVNDKRNNTVVLTTKGLKLSERLKNQGDKHFQSILERIPKNKINEILNSLEVLINALELDN
ncbi:MAG: MarR family winged helix-turn-helix transcriptional regulator [Bacteriovorax sp.]|nr:MarR family winged helix-turn-helix transcriptional regulator [Bacteriovorax sp.]